MTHPYTVTDTHLTMGTEDEPSGVVLSLLSVEDPRFPDHSIAIKVSNEQYATQMTEAEAETLGQALLDLVAARVDARIAAGVQEARDARG